MARRGAPVWPVWVLLLIAAALEVIPLPEALQPLRPPLPAIAIIYWTMMWPRRFNLGAAWIIGLLLDLLHGQLLGQNAFALTVVAYLTLRFHLQIRIFPLWQLTMTVFALLAIDAFLQFWIEGVAGVASVDPGRWIRIVIGALLWPPLMAIMDRVRMNIETRETPLT